MVAVLSKSPVQGAIFGRSGDAPRESLVDVDVLDIVLIFIMLNVEGYGGQANSSARKPAHTL